MSSSDAAPPSVAGVKRPRQENAQETANEGPGREQDDEEFGPRPPKRSAGATHEGEGGMNDNRAGDDSDDDYGPKIPSAAVAAAPLAAAAEAPQKQVERVPAKRTGMSEQDKAIYLQAMPSAGLYERSYMHKEPLTGILVCPSSSSAASGGLAASSSSSSSSSGAAVDDFIVTASGDAAGNGTVKMWKKLPAGECEFVKAFRVASPQQPSSSSSASSSFSSPSSPCYSPILGMALSWDGMRLLTINERSEGQGVWFARLFDVRSFDLVMMIPLGFAPLAVSWLYSSSQSGSGSANGSSNNAPLFAISERYSSTIHIFDLEKLGTDTASSSSSSSSSSSASSSSFDDDGDGPIVFGAPKKPSSQADGQKQPSESSSPAAAAGVAVPVKTLSGLHTAPVLAISYSPRFNMAVSADSKGVLEYWSASSDLDFATPASLASSSSSSSKSGVVSFRFKSETGLFDLAKSRAQPLSIAMSRNDGGSRFAVLSTDSKVRVFDFRSGKVLLCFDESPDAYQKERERDLASAAGSSNGNDNAAEMSISPFSSASLEAADFTRRLAIEKELQQAFTKGIAGLLTKPSTAASSVSAAGSTVSAGLPPLLPAFPTAVFDDSGFLLSYPCLMGIRVRNLATSAAAAGLASAENESSNAAGAAAADVATEAGAGKTVALLGNLECQDGQRFLAVGLYQGTPVVSSQFSLAKAEAAAAASGLSYGAMLNQQMIASRAAAAASTTGGAELFEGQPQPDPTFFASSYRRNRFFMFTRREPTEASLSTSSAAAAHQRALQGFISHAAGTGRDVWNEKPSKEDLLAAASNDHHQHGGGAGGAGGGGGGKPKICHEAVIHTTKGDLFLRLLPSLAPKACENFTGHSRSGYYAGVIFHRVIKGFMVQTGDPDGTGCGGESIWGREFEDECDRSVRFDRPGVLAMANSGPCTNGSQFFITTAPCEWLNNKHTIFGRLTAGNDVLSAIENAATNPKNDKPLEAIRIISVDVK